MDNYKLAEVDYNEGMKYKDIAKKYDVSINTVKSWKYRKWNKVAQEKSVHTKESKVAHKKKVPRIIEKLDDSDLTEQQKMFCLYYLQSFNATQSYINAYKCDYTAAMANGSRLLRNDSIKAQIDNLKKELQSEEFYTAQDIMMQYAKQAFSDITNFVDFGTKTILNEETGEAETYSVSYVELKDSAQVDGALIQEVKKGKDGVSIKLYDKQKAMQELLKRLTDSGNSDGNITIVDAWSDSHE